MSVISGASADMAAGRTPAVAPPGRWRRRLGSRESLTGLAVALVFGAPAIAMLYAAVRRAGRNWWIWAGGIVLVLMIFGGIVAPVVIAPLFNTYTPLPPGEGSVVAAGAGSFRMRAWSARWMSSFALE